MKFSDDFTDEVFSKENEFEFLAITTLTIVS
jgi:hypothetical protein